MESNQTLDPGTQYRPGSYPHADEANVWGELYLQFAQARQGSLQLPEEDRGAYCLASYEALFWWGYDRVAGVKEWESFYEEYDGKTLTPSGMNRVLGMMKVTLGKQELWGRRGLSEFTAPELPAE